MKTNAIFLLTALLLTNITSLYAQEKPQPKVNYVEKINELEKQGRDENLNATPFYDKAAELYVDVPEQLEEVNILDWPSSIDSQQMEALKNWLEENKKAFLELKRGSLKPHCWRQYQGENLMEMQMPHLASIRQLTYALCFRAKLKALDGNYKDAFSDIRIAYRMGFNLRGMAIEGLVGISLQSIANKTTRQILTNTNPDPESLKYLQRKLQQYTSKKHQAIDYDYEKYFSYDFIQRSFTDDGQGDGHIPESSMEDVLAIISISKKLTGDESQTDIENIKGLSRKQTTKASDKIYDYLQSKSKITPYQRHENNIDIDADVNKMAGDNSLLKNTMLTKVAQLQYGVKADNGALITIIAIHRYKAKKGQLPENLQQLKKAGLLRNLPADPFGPGLLTYKSSGDNFILYSYAFDFDDDRGQQNEQWGRGKEGGDQLFWPLKEK